MAFKSPADYEIVVLFVPSSAFICVHQRFLLAAIEQITSH